MFGKAWSLFFGTDLAVFGNEGDRGVPPANARAGDPKLPDLNTVGPSLTTICSKLQRSGGGENPDSLMDGAIRLTTAAMDLKK